MLTKWVEGVARPPYYPRPKTARIYEKPSQDRVLACICKGLHTAPEIGKELDIHPHSARNYLHCLRDKGFIYGTLTAGKPTVWRLK